MSITVLLQKTRASYVPRFKFFDKKFGVQIANVQKISIFVKKFDFSKKNLGSQDYSFQGRGLCFEILTLYIQGKNSGLKKSNKIVIQYRQG